MVPATIGSDPLASRFFGFRYHLAFRSVGANSICRASAALAIAAIQPRDENSDDRLVFTVLDVTIRSGVAMIVCPIVNQALGFNDVTAGICSGATIHDLAPVAAAGFPMFEKP